MSVMSWTVTMLQHQPGSATIQPPCEHLPRTIHRQPEVERKAPNLNLAEVSRKSTLNAQAGITHTKNIFPIKE